MSGKVVQLTLFPELEKEMTVKDIEKYFTALFAKNSALLKFVKKISDENEELATTVKYLKERVDNISENYLEKIP